MKEIHILDLLEGREFVDPNGHVWLSVGTENYDDYYPGFVFRWSPLQIQAPHDLTLSVDMILARAREFSKGL